MAASNKDPSPLVNEKRRCGKHGLIYQMNSQPIAVITAGTLTGVLASFFAISYTSLIFAGDLSGYVPTVVAFFIQGALIIGLISALFSSFRGAIATVQDVPAAMYAVLASTMVGQMRGSATTEEMFATLVAGLILTALMVGVGFWILGTARLGNLIWYIPFPVTAGFLSGVGLYLIIGAIQIATGVPFDWAGAHRLFAPATLTQWAPTVAVGGMLFVLTRRFRHPYVLPIFLAILIAGFHVWLHIAYPPNDGPAWTLSMLPSGALWQLPDIDLLAMANWSVLLANIGGIGSIMIVCHLSMLMNVSGIDMQSDDTTDINRELKVIGSANLLLGLTGSSSGYNSLSLSSLTERMQAKRRLTGITHAVTCGMILTFGGSLLQHVPKIAMSGILFYLGLNFLKNWLFAPLRRLSRTEFAIVILITTTMQVFSALISVGIGLMLSVALFVYSYSRVDIIRTSVSGKQRHSNVERTLSDEQLLRKKGDQIYILELEGFIFFGAGNLLTQKVFRRLEDPLRLPLRYLLLDLRLVNGIDASAAQAIIQLQQSAARSHYTMIFSNMTPVVASRVAKTLQETAETTKTLIFEDADRGLEWCENQILHDAGNHLAPARSVDLGSQLRQYTTVTKEERDRLNALIQVQRFEAGQVFIEHDQRPLGLYFVASGHVSVILACKNGRTLRIRGAGPGTIYGEISHYAKMMASASLVTDVPTTLHLLTHEALNRMEHEMPALSVALHKYVAKVLSERLATMTKKVTRFVSVAETVYVHSIGSTW